MPNIQFNQNSTCERTVRQSDMPDNGATCGWLEWGSSLPTEKFDGMQGVNLVVEDLTSGARNVKRITFSKSTFTPEEASTWLKKNKQAVFQQHNLQFTSKRGTKSRTASLRAATQHLLYAPSGTSDGSEAR